jgi:hypothetical protein
VARRSSASVPFTHAGGSGGGAAVVKVVPKRVLADDVRREGPHGHVQRLELDGDARYHVGEVVKVATQLLDLSFFHYSP